MVPDRKERMLVEGGVSLNKGQYNVVIIGDRLISHDLISRDEGVGLFSLR